MLANKKSGYILLLGETNAGKSTFLNKLLGQKVSIVSHKVQTTISKILGIYTDANYQLIFLDTPGIFQPKNSKDANIVKISYNSIYEADIIILFVDAVKLLKQQQLVTHDVLARLVKIKDQQKIVLVINKVDQIKDKSSLLTTINALDLTLFHRVFYISAIKNSGIKELLLYLQNNITREGFDFAEDDLSDKPLWYLAKEYTRESIYHFLHKEIPYSLVVEHGKWQEDQNHITIEQTIYFMKNSYRAILIGTKGQMIKNIIKYAEYNLTNALGKRVTLKLDLKYTKVVDHKDKYL